MRRSNDNFGVKVLPMSFLYYVTYASGLDPKKNGRGGETVYEPDSNNSYLSVFITHFLNNPKENIGILRKLYIDFNLSLKKVSEFTDRSWSKTAIIEALQKHGIKKSEGHIPSKSKYGYKVVNGDLQPIEKEQKAILMILNLYEQNNSLRKIATILNDKNIKSKSGGLWEKTVVGAIIKREQKRKV